MDISAADYFMETFGFARIGDPVTVKDIEGTWQVIGFEEGMVRCKQGDIELCFDKENINATNTPG